MELFTYKKLKNYYFINVKGNPKTIKVEEAEILRASKGLGLTEKEQLQLWLECEEYLINEEQEALNKKAEASGVKIFNQEVKERKKSTRERKTNPVKEEIIEKVAAMLKQNYNKVIVENVGKIITFEVDGRQFKIDLIEKRAKKTE